MGALTETHPLNIHRAHEKINNRLTCNDSSNLKHVLPVAADHTWTAYRGNLRPLFLTEMLQLWQLMCGVNGSIDLIILYYPNRALRSQSAECGS